MKERAAASLESSDRIEKLESEVAEVLLRLQNSENDAADAREKADAFRRQTLDLEAKIEEYKSLPEEDKLCENSESFNPINHVEEIESQKRALDEKVAELEDQLKDSNANLHDNRMVISRLEEDLQRSRNALTVAETKIEGLERATSTASNENAEVVARERGSAEKIKKLKILLTKSKQLNDDKDVEISKLKEDHVAALKEAATASTARPSACTIKSRMLVDQDGWVFIYEEPSEKCRWVLENVVALWSAEGTVVINNCEEYINVSLQKRLTESQLSYENEIEFLKSEIDEHEKKFIAYKERAQQALKRMTKDEQEVRKKARDAENW